LSTGRVYSQSDASHPVVLDPIKLVIENYPEGKEETMDVPNHPQKPHWGKRQIPFSRELWIERDDFQETPPKGCFRLFPGNKVRLRCAYVVECTGYDKATDTVRCTYIESTRSGTPGADSVKVKGNIHWVSVKHAYEAEVREYDRLFNVEHPEGKDQLNPNSNKALRAQAKRRRRHTLYVGVSVAIAEDCVDLPTPSPTSRQTVSKL
jgi:glutaminyl-tRNA synthetase